MPRFSSLIVQTHQHRRIPLIRQSRCAEPDALAKSLKAQAATPALTLHSSTSSALSKNVAEAGPSRETNLSVTTRLCPEHTSSSLSLEPFWSLAEALTSL